MPQLTMLVATLETAGIHRTYLTTTMDVTTLKLLVLILVNVRRVAFRVIVFWHYPSFCIVESNDA